MRHFKLRHFLSTALGRSSNNYPLSIQFVVSVIKLQNNIRKLPAESIKFL